MCLQASQGIRTVKHKLCLTVLIPGHLGDYVLQVRQIQMYISWEEKKRKEKKNTRD